MPVSVCQAKMTAKKEDFTIIFLCVDGKVFSRQSSVVFATAERMKSPIQKRRLSFAALTCRQWQTSEAQLSHRSRKGAAVLQM